MPKYTQHQHSQAGKTNPAVKPVGDYYAERGAVVRDGSGGVTHGSATVVRATQTMQRPYEEPKRRRKDNPDLKLCAREGCRAYPLKDQDICVGHARQEGTLPSQLKKELGDEAD